MTHPDAVALIGAVKDLTVTVLITGTLMFVALGLICASIFAARAPG